MKWERKEVPHRSVFRNLDAVGDGKLRLGAATWRTQRNIRTYVSTLILAHPLHYVTSLLCVVRQRDAVPHAHRCTQMWTVSVINL